MKRQLRNRILLWIIALGLTNFVIYTLAYWFLGGDAPNGGFQNGAYFLRGHFIWSGAGQRTDPVSRGVWIYSFLHSISIWPTVAGVLVSMLILARPHIIATMKSESPLRGMTYVNICILVIIGITGTTTLLFVRDFFAALAQTAAGNPYNA